MKIFHSDGTTDVIVHLTHKKAPDLHGALIFVIEEVSE